MNFIKRLAVSTLIAVAVPVAMLAYPPLEAMAGQQGQTLLLTIPGNSQASADKGIKKRIPVEVSGTIEQGHDPAGGNFWINGGKKKQYTIRYLFDLDEAMQTELGKLADSQTRVTIKGTLRIWKDGSASFDDAKPVTIFK